MLLDPSTANVTEIPYDLHCDGRKYGTDLNIASCTEALDQIDASSTVDQTYGPRFRGPYDVKLPKRYISC